MSIFMNVYRESDVRGNQTKMNGDEEEAIN